MTFFRKHGLAVVLVIAGTGLTAGLVYIMTVLGDAQPDRLEPVASPSAPPFLAAEPTSTFRVLDPAVQEDVAQAESRAGSALQDVGDYQPDVATNHFALPTATLQPTPRPYHMARPLPLPYVPDNLPPTVSASTPIPADDNGIRSAILPYDGTGNCAPAGKPVDGILTQFFHTYHGGIDLGVPSGTPVRATHSGQVTFAGWSEVGYGYLVVVESGRFATYYAHNTSFNVAAGDYVGKSSIIAFSGNTGRSSGPHVHYETRIDNVVVDPLTFESRGYPTC